MDDLQTVESLRPDTRVLSEFERAAMRAELFGDRGEEAVAEANGSRSDDVDLVRFDLDDDAVRTIERVPRRSWLAAAAAVIVLVGLGGVWLTISRDIDESPAPAQQPDPAQRPDTSPAVTPATSLPEDLEPASSGSDAAGNVVTLPWSDNDGWYESPFDPIPIARGTIGWFEAGDGLPSQLAGRSAHLIAPSNGATAAFFACREWTLTSGVPTCTMLTGGNFVEHVHYGDQLEIGVQLGGTDARTQLSIQASGSLWGYDIDLPEPTVIPIGDIEGYSYRNDDHSYMAWEYQPGVVVWLEARGLDDTQLAEIAAGVRPATLPDELPVLLQLDETTIVAGDPVNSSLSPALKLGYLDGQPCVGFELWDECVAPDEPALFGTAVWGDGRADRYAATVPAGTSAEMRVNLFDIGWRTVPFEPTEFGFDVAIWDGEGRDRLLEAQLVNANGDIVIEAAHPDPIPGRRSAIVAEGHNDVAWVVHRQDPATADQPDMVYHGEFDGDMTTYPYCLLLSGPFEFAPLCPADTPPSNGLGQRADYHHHLNLVEIADDTTRVVCDGTDMPIFTDPELDDRRFAVTTCDNPTTNP